VSLFYLDNAESCNGLPIKMHFLELFCNFYMKRLTIGVREITEMRDDSYCDKSLE
jgi:hypothetical protein